METHILLRAGQRIRITNFARILGGNDLRLYSVSGLQLMNQPADSGNTILTSTFQTLRISTHFCIHRRHVCRKTVVVAVDLKGLRTSTKFIGELTSPAHSTFQRLQPDDKDRYLTTRNSLKTDRPRCREQERAGPCVCVACVTRMKR